MKLTFSKYILTKISDSIERSWSELLDPAPASLARSHRIEHERIAEEREREKKKRKLYSTLYYLKQNQFIKEIAREKDKKYRLTSKGMLKVSKIKSRLILKKKKVSERKNLLVIFDIPESKKKDRDFFRKGLMLLGFEKKQLSVWFSPYNLLKEVKEWANLCGVEDYVKYFFVEEV